MIWVHGQVTSEVSVVHPEWDPDERSWVVGTEANSAANGVGNAYDEYPFSVPWAGESELAGTSGATVWTATQGATFDTTGPWVAVVALLITTAGTF